MPTAIIIIDKNATIKSLNVKEYSEEDLYKKCGFKKSEGFKKQNVWNVTLPGGNGKYSVSVFAKTDGKANMENKYDFPPPIDNVLFFGACALVCCSKNPDGTSKLCDLTIPLWEAIYEKLFGGFEDLSATYLEDEYEEDELANIPKEKKTKDGYLKDNFVVDTDDSSDYSFQSTEEDTNTHTNTNIVSADDDELDLEDIGSELGEEEYD